MAHAPCSRAASAFAIGRCAIVEHRSTWLHTRVEHRSTRLHRTMRFVRGQNILFIVRVQSGVPRSGTGRRTSCVLGSLSAGSIHSGWASLLSLRRDNPGNEHDKAQPDSDSRTVVEP